MTGGFSFIESIFQEAEEDGVDLRGRLLLYPVVAAAEAQLRVRRVHVVGDAGDRLGDDGEVALAVDVERGDAHALVLSYLPLAEAAAEEGAEVGAVVVDAARDRSRLAQRGLEDFDVPLGERARPRGRAQHLTETREVSTLH